jgi:hypothetical protein
MTNERDDSPTALGEVGDRLRALIAHWQSEAARLDASPFEDQLEDQAWVYKRCANELDALLSAPVVKEGHYSQITDVPTLRRMVQRAINDMRDAMVEVDELRARLSAPVGSGWHEWKQARCRQHGDGCRDLDCRDSGRWMEEAPVGSPPQEEAMTHLIARWKDRLIDLSRDLGVHSTRAAELQNCLIELADALLSAPVVPSCGMQPGNGPVEWYGCIEPHGHDGSHRNKSGYEWLSLSPRGESAEGEFGAFANAELWEGPI